MKSEAADAVAASIATKITYGGGFVGFLGWLFSSQGVGLVGVCAAIGGLLVNWYYKHRADQRSERLARLREDYIRNGRRTDTDLGDLGEDE